MLVAAPPKKKQEVAATHFQVIVLKLSCSLCQDHYRVPGCGCSIILGYDRKTSICRLPRHVDNNQNFLISDFESLSLLSTVSCYHSVHVTFLLPKEGDETKMMTSLSEIYKADRDRARGSGGLESVVIIILCASLPNSATWCLDNVILVAVEAEMWQESHFTARCTIGHLSPALISRGTMGDTNDKDTCVERDASLGKSLNVISALWRASHRPGVIVVSSRVPGNGLQVWHKLKTGLVSYSDLPGADSPLFEERKQDTAAKKRPLLRTLHTQGQAHYIVLMT